MLDLPCQNLTNIDAIDNIIASIPIIDLTDMLTDSQSNISITDDTIEDNDEVTPSKVASLLTHQGFTLGTSIGSFECSNVSFSSMFKNIASVNTVNSSPAYTSMTPDDISVLSSPKLSGRFKFKCDFLQTTRIESFTKSNRGTKIHSMLPTPIPTFILNEDTVSSTEDLSTIGKIYVYARFIVT